MKRLAVLACGLALASLCHTRRGAKLSDEADPHRRPVSSRRHIRHHRAHARPEVDRRVGPADDHGQPRRRRGQHRHGGRGEIAARRLHAGGRQRRPGGDQPQHLPERRLRSAQGPDRGHARGYGAAARGGASIRAREVVQGVHCAGEVTQGQAQLRLERAGQHLAPRGGDLQDHGEGGPGPHPLQGLRPHHHRSPRRPRRRRLLRHGGRAAARPGRTAPRAGGDEPRPEPARAGRPHGGGIRRSRFRR